MKKYVLAALLVPATAAFAHGVWIAPHYGELGVVYGMGYADDSYAPEKVQFVHGYDGHFNPTATAIHARDKYSTIDIDDDTAVLTAFFDNGYWEKGEQVKWQAVEKQNITAPEETSTSLKYNITVLKPYHGAMKPFDLPVQIIPDVDPTTLKQGETLGVTVLVDGQPQADVPVTADYINDFANRVNTDAEGHATLTVRNAAHNVVAALVNHPTPNDPLAHLQRSVATLSFKAAKP